MVKVYPRACGGTMCPGLGRMSRNGLSPRLRGNQCLSRFTRHIVGSIPALAGEPVTPCRVYRRRWVYPRACGGTNVKERIDDPKLGLSPRLRGNQCNAECECNRSRSIPALAGEPRYLGHSDSGRTVYPRACGGTYGCNRSDATPPGLSPRLRGNQPTTRWSPSLKRSIPALAGEPSSCIRGRSKPRVYPRACGGTPILMMMIITSSGLSPRLRGNHLWPTGKRKNSGSIPALAGEPIIRHQGDMIKAVYPRACGGTY